MGYFSNVQESEIYNEDYCRHCVHRNMGCPVLAMHFFFQDKQFEDELLKDIFDSFIPQEEDGTNGKCTMFVPVAIMGDGTPFESGRQ